MRLLLALSFLIFLAACDKDDKIQNEVGIDDYIVLKNFGFSKTEWNGIDGGGWVEFLKPLYGVDSNHHIHLRFRFYDEGGNISVISNYSNTEMSDGVKISISKEQDELNVQIETPGMGSYDVSEHFKGVARWNWLDLRIEIHENGTEPLRVLFWRGGSHRYTVENSIFDSQREGLSFQTNGLGSTWGLQTSKTHVKIANLRRPYVVE